jgi:hypothetical protein
MDLGSMIFRSDAITRPAVLTVRRGRGDARNGPLRQLRGGDSVVADG